MFNIVNATITERWRNDVFLGYFITPNPGYALHDKDGDWENPEGELSRAYYVGACSCGPNYNYNDTTIIDGYTAYGTREFFARPQSEIPADQIFGVDNDHEVM